MSIVPDGELLLGQGGVVLFDDGRLLAQLEVAVQYLVETHARDRVVVVREVFAALQRHEVLLAVEPVELLQVGKAFGRHLLRPVVGRIHALWLRGEEGGDFDITRINPKEGGVLTGAAALHRGADHYHRVGQGEARVGRRQEHRLRTAAAGAGHREAGRIDFGKGEEEVDAADRVQGLQSHHALQVGFGLGAVESPAFGAVHVRALLGELMDDLRRELLRV